MTMVRCTSTWRQMPHLPLIQCARKDGHDGNHWNVNERRQWAPGQATADRAECPSCLAGTPVPHTPSTMCRSGKRPHCTCDACF